MSLSLQDLLKKEVKKMVLGIGKNEKGNIFPLITEEVEQIIIKLVLQETNFNFLQTSKLLGISRSTLYRKIGEYGISEEAMRAAELAETERLSHHPEQPHTGHNFYGNESNDSDDIV